MAERGGRLEFLDCGRGIAALSVTLMHIVWDAYPPSRTLFLRYFNPGVFGVITFFLISGFIIPFSLERLGSLRRFWINRAFRLLPLYWGSLAAALLLWRAGISSPSGEFLAAPLRHALWNLTMVQSLFGVPDAVGLYWTLAYEMVFYAAMSLLFLVRLNRRSLAIVLVGVAYLGYGGIIRPLVSGGYGISPPDFWGFTFFVGTMVYRAHSGEVGWRAAGWALAAVGLLIVGDALVNIPRSPHRNDPLAIQSEAVFLGWLLAYAFFLALVALRHRSFPRPLVWLGKISYSVYLVHGLVLQVVAPRNHFSPPVAGAIHLAATLVVSALSYHFLEEPFMRMGRRFVARRAADATEAVL